MFCHCFDPALPRFPTSAEAPNFDTRWWRSFFRSFSKKPNQDLDGREWKQTWPSDLRAMNSRLLMKVLINMYRVALFTSMMRFLRADTWKSGRSVPRTLGQEFYDAMLPELGCCPA